MIGAREARPLSAGQQGGADGDRGGMCAVERRRARPIHRDLGSGVPIRPAHGLSPPKPDGGQIHRPCYIAPMPDSHDHEEEKKTGRFRRLGRRILGELDEGKPIRMEAREALGAILDTSDRAKTEIVRAVAREVRNYVEELGLKDDLHNLATNYSVEFRASIHLKRLTDEEKGPVTEAPRSEARPEARSEARSEGRSELPAEARPEIRPEGRVPGEGPQDRSRDRSRDRADRQPGAEDGG